MSEVTTKAEPTKPEPTKPEPKSEAEAKEKKQQEPVKVKPTEVKPTRVTSNSDNAPTKESRVRLPAHMEPTFYIGGGNGVTLLEEICTGMGWKRITDKRDESYRLKWCELKSTINYYTFKEGDQMVNHIPNCNLLTNKLGLLNSLQEYDRMCQAVKKRALKLDFIPETFRLDDPRDRNAFRTLYQDGEQWICKPTGKNQGKGIFIVKNQEEVNKIFEEQEERTQDGKPMKPLNRIIQRYLNKPLLLNKKKFDIRCYMLIANTVPYLVLYHHGYVRLTIHDYDDDTDNLIAHLTNQFIQKKDPSYKDVKDDTTWSMQKFNDYVNENCMQEKGIEKDWALSVLPARIKQIMTYCFTCVKSRLQCKIGYNDLYGFDFMIDENMKIWLIEVNVNPCLATNCEALKEVVPEVVRETIHITNECFEKARKGRPLLPLNTIKGFEVIYSHGGKTPRKMMTSSPYRKDMVSRAGHQPQPPSTEKRVNSSTPMHRTAAVASPVKETAISKDTTTPQSTKPTLQYTLNKHGDAKSERTRARNVPTATPTIINPGNGLPATHRSNTFAQLRGGGPPSNAAINTKAAPNSSNLSKSSNSGLASQRTISRTMSRLDEHKKSKKDNTNEIKQTEGKSTAAITKPNSGKEVSAGSAQLKATQKPVKDTALPPHHQKLKRELRSKMTTSTEAIIIRNVTAKSRKSVDSVDKVRKVAKVSKNSDKDKAQSASTQNQKDSKPPRITPAQKDTLNDSESEAMILSDNVDNSDNSEYGDSDNETSSKKDNSVINSNQNNSSEKDRSLGDPFSPRSANTNDTTKKISLQIIPHGTRGSKDGGKPSSAMRFAAMYPTSPYIDPMPIALPTGPNGSVAQLRMTHNGVVQRSRRVSNLRSENEKPNRGS